MHRNRSRMADLGLLYPRTPGRSRHTRLSLFIQADDALAGIPTWHRQQQSDPAKFRQTFRRRLFREINQSGLPRLLLSDEALYGSKDDALGRLRRFTDRIAGSLRVVVYLRRQDDHLVSRYQQVVKTGEIRRLDERLRQLDLTKTYDYYARLHTWERLLQPDEFVVRRFERDRFRNGSLFQDFLDAAGIDAQVEDLEQIQNRNESLDAESVEFLRLLNLCRVENEGAKPGLIDNRELVRQLSDAGNGPVLTLPTQVLDDFMSKWEEGNRALARRWFGDPDGELFQAPRKSRHTTTDQVFDPARLDHFLTLVELPEPLHAPLRVLAERAAKDR